MLNERIGEGFKNIVYTLVYPGVLASMLYDLYQNIADDSKQGDLFFLLYIVVLYLFDYFHLFTDMKSNKRSGKYNYLYYSIDLLIAILFGLSFAYAKNAAIYKCTWIITWMVILMFIYSVVELVENRLKFTHYLRERWIYPVFLCIFCFIIFYPHKYSDIWLIVGLFVVNALYVIYLFLSYKPRKVHEGNATQKTVLPDRLRSP